MLSNNLTTLTVLALAAVSMAASIERRIGESLAGMKTDENKLLQELATVKKQEANRVTKIGAEKDLHRTEYRLGKLEAQGGNVNGGAVQKLRQEIHTDRQTIRKNRRDLEFEELLERNLELEEELLTRDFMDFDDLFERDFEFDELD